MVGSKASGKNEMRGCRERWRDSGRARRCWRALNWRGPGSSSRKAVVWLVGSCRPAAKVDRQLPRFSFSMRLAIVIRSAALLL
jgi:hypothetical protein